MLHPTASDFVQAIKLFIFLNYPDDITLSSTLNTFNDNIHDQNLETIINEELFKISEWLKIKRYH